MTIIMMTIVMMTVAASHTPLLLIPNPDRAIQLFLCPSHLHWLPYTPKFQASFVRNENLHLISPSCSWGICPGSPLPPRTCRVERIEEMRSPSEISPFTEVLASVSGMGGRRKKTLWQKYV